jgi:hypothetical protein
VKRALVAVTLLGAACADELPAGSHLERTRVLAVSMTPVDDPARAWPRAGEDAELAVLVAAPGELPRMTWHLDVCASSCTAFEGTGVPHATYTVPAAATTITVKGSLVPDGEPATDFELAVQVESDPGVTNHHPQMGEVTVPEGCVDAGGADVVITVTTAATDRESYLGEDGATAREALRLSFFAGAGELARQFAVVEADDTRAAPVVEMKWTPPLVEDVPAEGMDVKLVIVERDLRGGVDFVERTLCVKGTVNR